MFLDLEKMSTVIISGFSSQISSGSAELVSALWINRGFSGNVALKNGLLKERTSGRVLMETDALWKGTGGNAEFNDGKVNYFDG